jgi:hypothetical protein
MTLTAEPVQFQPTQAAVRSLLTNPGRILGPEELEHLCARIYSRPELWCPLIDHDGDSSAASLYQDPEVGVWVISWSPRGDSGTHGHPGSGAVLVAEGTIREERAVWDAGTLACDRHQGQSFRLCANEVHRVHNASAQRAVTIHCSSPPPEEGLGV